MPGPCSSKGPITGGNTYENRRSFDRYFQSFAPQVVILGYNHNDVYGRQEPKPTNSPAAPPLARAAASGLDGVRVLRQCLAASKALEVVLVKVNMELKLAGFVGFVLPGTEFAYLVRQSHATNYPGWRLSQPHLRYMATTCRLANVQFVAYLVPELEMLPHYQVFDSVDGVLSNFFSGLGVPCILGVETFLARGQFRNLSLRRAPQRGGARYRGRAIPAKS